MQFKSIKTKIILMAAGCIVLSTTALIILQIIEQNKCRTFVSAEVNQLV